MARGKRSSQGMRNLRSAGWDAAKFTGRTTEKAVVSLFRWASTDHINKGRPIQFIPGTTFLGSLGYILLELFLGILTAVLTGAIAYVMIVYGIPLFFSLMFGD